MTRWIIVALTGAGSYLLVTTWLLGWKGIRRPRPRTATRPRADRWLSQAGLEDVNPRQFAAATMALATVAGLFSYALFEGVVPTALAAAAGAMGPPMIHRHRRTQRRWRAHQAWPSMIEEIRVLSGPAGLSIPQALFDVGRRAPEELRWAFEMGERHWRMTTDFDETICRLKDELADPTADVTLETLLVAHGLGDGGLDARLSALAEDRSRELAGRKDAVARQAGARFARSFVLIVPLGMTLAGLSLGTGRAAYATPIGQALVALALFLMGGCWLWASRLLRLPPTRRVFVR